MYSLHRIAISYKISSAQLLYENIMERCHKREELIALPGVGERRQVVLGEAFHVPFAVDTHVERVKRLAIVKSEAVS